MSLLPEDMFDFAQSLRDIYSSVPQQNGSWRRQSFSSRVRVYFPSFNHVSFSGEGYLSNIPDFFGFKG